MAGDRQAASLRSGGRLLLVCSVGMAWGLMLLSGLAAVTLDPSRQVVFVRWVSSTTAELRQHSEGALGLRQGTVWDQDSGVYAYHLADVSPAAIARLVAHPLVADTGNINRARFTVHLDRPGWPRWMAALGEGRWLYWLVVLITLLAGAFTWTARHELALPVSAGGQATWESYLGLVGAVTTLAVAAWGLPLAVVGTPTFDEARVLYQQGGGVVAVGALWGVLAVLALWRARSLVPALWSWFAREWSAVSHWQGTDDVQGGYTLVCLYLMASAALALAVVSYVTHVAGPVLERHGWRQTQTALTAYWFLREGARLDYQLPVLGAPWSAPFELPVFQLLAAFTKQFSGLSLDAAGRTVSFAFFLMTLWPMYLLGRALRLPRTFFPTAATLYACAPMYLFWGRTFMIESTALFFALLFLALGLRAHDVTRPPSLWTAGALFVSGALALTVKVTTAACPFLVVAVASAHAVIRDRRMEESRGCVAGRRYAIVCALAAAFVCLVVWTRYTDDVKSHGVLTALLRSTEVSMMRWNFGPIGQRLSSDLWRETILDRSLALTLGAKGLIVVLAVLALWTRPSELRALCVFVALYLLPFLVFTNLHVVHDYYQYANAIFLLLASAVAVAAVGRHRGGLALAVLIVVVGLQLRTFSQVYLMPLHGDNDLVLVRSDILKRRVRPDAAFLAVGLDWSPELPYYSERRAIMLPQLATDLQLGAVAGGVPIDAILVCPERKPHPKVEAVLKRITKDATKETVAGCDLFSNPNYPPG
jgi:hypothetical protein